MNNGSRGVMDWVTPELEQIEMVDTSNLSGGCMPMDPPPGSKQMTGNENPTNNCSTGS